MNTSTSKTSCGVQGWVERLGERYGKGRVRGSGVTVEGERLKGGETRREGRERGSKES